MKRLHKILMGGAVALALAVAFAGCKNANDTVGEAEMISYTDKANANTGAEVTVNPSRYFTAPVEFIVLVVNATDPVGVNVIFAEDELPVNEALDTGVVPAEKCIYE